MRRSPAVTIVTAAYNAAAYMPRYVAGIAAQQYENLEVVFVDDGSEDGTHAALQAELSRANLPRETLRYVPQPNRGPCAAVNVGLSLARGEVLLFCDSDDRLLPGAVGQFIAAFESHPDADLIYTRYVFRDEAGKDLGGGPEVPMPPEGVYEALLGRGMFIKAGAYCFRRRCLEVLPERRLNESCYGQNLELLLRVSATMNVAFHDAVTVAITVHSQSRSRKRDLAALRRQVLDSKRLQLDIASEYGCSSATRRRLDARFLPGESQLYFLEGKTLKVFGCLLRALRFGKPSRRLWLHAVFSLMPATRRYLVRKWYAAYR